MQASEKTNVSKSQMDEKQIVPKGVWEGKYPHQSWNMDGVL